MINREEILNINRLKKYYRINRNYVFNTPDYVRAVDDVSFAVYRGETLGIVGESGCGKTTLGRCILRIEEPSDGDIIYNNRSLLKYPAKEIKEMRREIQIIFQNPYSSLNPCKTVRRTVSEGMDIHELYEKRERIEKVEELMNVVGIKKDQINRYPHEFSGGQRQRICIARALSLSPKLIVADEPVSALDVSIQAQIINLLVKLQNEFILTYIFISHDLRIIRHISDRVAVMYLGKIVELSDRDSIYAYPRHPYTEALLLSIPGNILSKTKNRTRFIEGDVPSPINPPTGCSFHTRCRHRKEICFSVFPSMEKCDTCHWVACHYPLM